MYEGKLAVAIGSVSLAASAYRTTSKCLHHAITIKTKTSDSCKKYSRKETIIFMLLKNTLTNKLFASRISHSGLIAIQGLSSCSKTDSGADNRE